MGDQVDFDDAWLESAKCFQTLLPGCGRNRDLPRKRTWREASQSCVAVQVVSARSKELVQEQRESSARDQKRRQHCFGAETGLAQESSRASNQSSR